MNHYVYIYIDPFTNIPFYVGYGKNKRYLDHLKEAKRHPIPQQSQYKLNKIRSIISKGSEPIIQIYKENLSISEAKEIEIELITKIGRKDLKTGPLTNATSGGDGVASPSGTAKLRISNNSKRYLIGIDLVENVSGIFLVDDPRWKSGQLIPINKGKSLYTNGLDYKILFTSDPLVLSGEYYRPNKGKCVVIDDNGNHLLVDIETKKLLGLTSMNKNKIPVKDENGNNLLIDKNDIGIGSKYTPLVNITKCVRDVKTGKVETINKYDCIPDGYVGLNKGGCANLVTLCDCDGHLYRVYKDDHRIGITLFQYNKTRKGNIPIIPTIIETSL